MNNIKFSEEYVHGAVSDDYFAGFFAMVTDLMNQLIWGELSYKNKVAPGTNAPRAPSPHPLPLC
jgi:hypothetical protein